MDGRKLRYIHPKLEPILKETYGVIVYQEQVIKIASEIGGLSLAQADLLRARHGEEGQRVDGEAEEGVHGWSPQQGN